MKTSSQLLCNIGMRPVHPLTKLYFTISTVVLSFLLDVTAQVLIAGLLLILSILTRQRWSIFKRFLRYVLPVVILVLVLNVLVYPESEKRITFLGLTLNEAGLHFGLIISLRLSVMSLSLLLFFASTQPHLLASALLMKGASPRLVYVFLHALQLVTTLRRKIEKVYIAQASHGLDVRGSPWSRAKAFFPMLLPLIFSYLSESLERGLALELRGLGIHGPKTYLVELKESRTERAANILLLLGTSIIVLWRFMRWLIP
jgi:energy-coupling factor transport system permease protein